VYFTFDDGPGAAFTLPVLDLLGRYGVRATFFLVGRNVAAEPSVARAIVDRGHVIGNHTWDHTNLTTLSADAIRSQLSRTQDAITSASGARPRCMRPPFGSVNSTVQSTVTGAGYSLELWTLDTRDFEATSADQIVARLDTLLTSSATVHNVLMHDWATHTPAALDRWLAANASRFDFRVMPSC
jgi:peptidoglycan/xylan/chitin deacetylase (PgdA/CDA1 family)